MPERRPEWKVLVVLLPILFLEVFTLAPMLVPASVEPHRELFLSFAQRACHPEPLEQLRFILLLFTIPIVSFCWLYFKVDDRMTKMMPSIATAVEALSQFVAFIFLLIALGWKNFFFDAVSQDKYWITGFVLLLTCIALYRLRTKLVCTSASPCRYVLLAAAIFLTGTNLLTNLFGWRALTHAAPEVSAHLPGTMGDFAAAYAGKTMFVDYFPIYQNFAQYVFEPCFRIFGLSPSTFTVSMTILSAVIFACAFLALHATTRSITATCLLFIPFVVLSFCTLGSGVERANNFNYFANGPLRYWGPSVLMFLLANYYSKPTRLNRMLLLFSSTTLAINSVEFGVPALAATCATTLLIDPERGIGSMKRALQVLGETTICMILVVAMICATTYMRSGDLPQLQKLFEYQRTFALEGYFMLPLPDTLLYWVPFGTWMIAIFLGLQSVLKPGEKNENVIAALLLASGIYGAGTAMYFVGRSSWGNLAALFPAWAFSLVLVLWSFVPTTVSHWAGYDARRKCLNITPLLMALVTYCMSWSHIIDTPNPIRQWERINGPPNPNAPLPYAFVESLSAVTTPGESVLILFPYADWLADQAHLKNWCPFSWRANLLLKSQLELTMNVIQKRNIAKVFGTLPPEMEQALAARGFEKRAELNPGAKYEQYAFDSLSSPFDYWLLPARVRRGNGE